MAKKTENKQTEQTVTPAVSEDKTVISENMSENADGEPERTESVSTPPESAPDAAENMVKMDEILNNDAELRENNAEYLDEGRGDEEPEPEEKILFYVKTVNDKTAIRSTPEYPMRGSNIVGTIDDRGPYGITEVVDGFGRLAGGTGWIMLDPGVVVRQG